MNDIAPSEINLDAVEAYLFSLPEDVVIDIPPVHHFGPGVYIREMTAPAGAFIMGHKHREPHLTMVLQGAMAVLMGGEVNVIAAPALFVAPPGRKVGLALVDTVVINLHATELTDVEALEEHLYERSAVYLGHKN